MVLAEMNALKGRTIAVTRDRKGATELEALVGSEGGRIIALSTIDIVPASRDAATKFMEELRRGKYDYCSIMSAQAADALFDMADRAQILESLKSTAVIAVGPKTRGRLEDYGVKVTLMPAEFSSRGLVQLMSGMKVQGKKIIIPRSSAAGSYAAEGLRSLGMAVTEVMLYGVRTSKPSKDWQDFAKLLRRGGVDAVIFTSASSVRSFFELLEPVLPGAGAELDKLTRLMSIGPFTSQELRNRRVKYFEAQEHTLRGTFELAKQVLRSY
jgi:uroporphyrinogen-III synthase